MDRNINWNDNIKPELNQARDAVAMKAFETAKTLLEQEKDRRCTTGDTRFAIAFGNGFFKGMSDAAKWQFLDLMKAEGYEYIVIWKGFLKTKCYYLFVPREVYEDAYKMANSEFSCGKNLENWVMYECRKDVAWYK